MGRIALLAPRERVPLTFTKFTEAGRNGFIPPSHALFLARRPLQCHSV
jgi:hypothetical protein